MFCGASHILTTRDALLHTMKSKIYLNKKTGNNAYVY
jgi:hypothetical protein